MTEFHATEAVRDELRDLLPRYLSEVGDDPWASVGDCTIDVGDYVSRQFYEREVAGLWNKVWQFACRANEIPEVGDYFEYEIVGQSVIVVRDSPESIRSFRNSCRHRATAVAEGSGNVSCFVCPFHGWTYGLDGSLKKRPANRDFADHPRAVLGLLPVRTAVFDGYVFINFDPDAEPLEQFLGDTLMSHLRVHPDENKRVEWSLGMIVSCNWKVMVEAFMEGYHVPVTHHTISNPDSESVLLPCAPFGLHARVFGYAGKDAQGVYDIPEMAKRLRLPVSLAMVSNDPSKATANALIYLATSGEALRSVRIPSEGLKSWGPQEMTEMNEKIREYWAARGLDLADVSDVALSGGGGAGLYTVFPNTLILQGAGGNLVYRVRPHGDDPTSCLFEMSWLTPVPPEQKPLKDASPQMLAPGEDFTSYQDPAGYLGVIIDQDVSNCRKVQKGFAARAHSHDPKATKIVAASMQEYNVVAFHRNLHAWLDSR